MRRLAGSAPALAPALALGLALAAAPARAQEAAQPTADTTVRVDSATADSLAAYGADIAPAPLQFRLAVTGGPFLWKSAPSRVPDNSAAWGIDVERILFRYLSLRLGASYLPTRVEHAAGSTDVRGYLLDVIAEPRIVVDPLERAGVVPFLTVGVGTLVLDPRQAGLPTRSENAFALGGGFEVRVLPRIGARAEWRRYSVALQSLFDPTLRTAEAHHANRLLVSLYWTF